MTRIATALLLGLLAACGASNAVDAPVAAPRGNSASRGTDQPDRTAEAPAANAVMPSAASG